MAGRLPRWPSARLAARQACSAIARTAPHSQVTAANGSSSAAHAGQPPAGEPPRRAVVLERASGTGARACSRPCTCTTAPAGSYATSPARAAQPPAQVDVLHVHEVALVPAADRVERVRAADQIAAPETQSTTRGRAGSASSWRYRAVNGFVGHHRPSRPCPTATRHGRRSRARRRVVGAVEVADARARTRRAAGSASKRGRASPRRCPAPRRDRGCSTATTGARVAAMPRFAARGVADVARRARRRATSGNARAQRVDRTVARAVVDDDELDRARARVGEHRPHALGEQRPGLVVDDDRGPGARSRDTVVSPGSGT